MRQRIESLTEEIDKASAIIDQLTEQLTETRFAKSGHTNCSWHIRHLKLFRGGPDSSEW